MCVSGRPGRVGPNGRTGGGRPAAARVRRSRARRPRRGGCRSGRAHPLRPGRGGRRQGRGGQGRDGGDRGERGGLAGYAVDGPRGGLQGHGGQHGDLQGQADPGRRGGRAPGDHDGRHAPDGGDREQRDEGAQPLAQRAGDREGGGVRLHRVDRRDGRGGAEQDGRDPRARHRLVGPRRAHRGHPGGDRRDGEERDPVDRPDHGGQQGAGGAWAAGGARGGERAPGGRYPPVGNQAHGCSPAAGIGVSAERPSSGRASASDARTRVSQCAPTRSRVPGSASSRRA
ncbi:hypothetical protein EHYA_01065 [Embleya hyalina]|uniref:Uncharacterized protein n=1 Tax=Embleya hyalina TaxID=516124 RepID=A0A401YFN7_9ACTN|nr:hypothetical protein EHYA_01065 [Embleya hyalina]